MNRSLDISISALTLAPLAGLMVSQSALVEAYADGPASAASLGEAISAGTWPAALGALVALVLLPFFAWHLFARSGGRSLLERLLWGLALVLLAPLSHPAYWFTRCRMPRSAPADATA